MDIQFNWEALAEEISEMATSGSASDVMDFGYQKKWFFRIMEENGVLHEPLVKSNWRYTEFDIDSTIIPDEAAKRLKAVTSQFDIKQLIIGHEIVEAPDVEAPEKTAPEREIKPTSIPWKGVASLAGTLVFGFAYVMVSGMLMAFSAADPRLIICLNDSANTWISICEWLD